MEKGNKTKPDVAGHAEILPLFPVLGMQINRKLSSIKFVILLFF